MNYNAELMDSNALSRSLTRIAHEILEANKGTDNLVLVGIKRRGIPLAKRIAANIKKIEGNDVPVCELDIKFYRDDLTKLNSEPELLKPFDSKVDLNGKNVVLIDDVIYTGRTVRAAMDAILDNARPEYIKLAIIIDRGHRQLPIRADFVGKNVPTAHDEHISLRINEIDNEEGVYLVKNS